MKGQIGGLMSQEDDDDPDRVLFFEIDGLTRVVRDCHDIDEIEQQVGFSFCPVCGGRREWKDGQGFLEHDPNYNQRVH
jgi:hypothetical protein